MRKPDHPATKEFDLRGISLGAGVQSSVMYLMACRGDFRHKPDFAIFADTGLEPRWVYEQMDYLESVGDIPIGRVSKTGGLRADLELAFQEEGAGRFASIPFWLKGQGGRAQPARRQCTRDAKIAPFKEGVRQRLGLERGQWAKGRFRVEQWIGISTDEVTRAKPSRDPWLVSHWPLITEIPMNRADCVDWCRRNNHPIPKRSACYLCPYHGDDEWRQLRSHDPDSWAEAVALDLRMREGGRTMRGMDEQQFLHRSLVPLGEVDLDPPLASSSKGPQLELFDEECEGMCGV